MLKYKISKIQEKHKTEELKYIGVTVGQQIVIGLPSLREVKNFDPNEMSYGVHFGIEVAASDHLEIWTLINKHKSDFKLKNSTVYLKKDGDFRKALQDAHYLLKTVDSFSGEIKPYMGYDSSLEDISAELFTDPLHNPSAQDKVRAEISNLSVVEKNTIAAAEIDKIKDRLQHVINGPITAIAKQLTHTETKVSQLLRGITRFFFANLSKKKHAILNSVVKEIGITSELTACLQAPIPDTKQLEGVKAKLYEIKSNLSNENIAILKTYRGFTFFGLRQASTTSDQIALALKESANTLYQEVDTLIEKISLVYTH
jgi:ribosomal protein L7/L12